MTKIVHFSQLSHAQDQNPSAVSSENGHPGNASLEKQMHAGVISIGNFDGVHVGHRALLSEVRRQAAAASAPSIAVIFDPHPAAILRPEFVPERLTWVERRAELMTELQIDYLLVIETTQAFLSLSAEAFYQSLIVDALHAKAIVEGPNFFFGRGRQGDVNTLAELSTQHQIEFTVAKPAEADDAMISSTRIRDLITRGDIQPANQFLGSSYRIRGDVVSGEKRGRTIGFPTANLANVDVVVPSHGVYAGVATVGDQTYGAAIHIGPNPTFGESANKIEVHLLDFAGDLYGQPMTVDFISFVRQIVRFDSTEHLVTQLRQDVTTIRDQLSPQPGT